MAQVIMTPMCAMAQFMYLTLAVFGITCTIQSSIAATKTWMTLQLSQQLRLLCIVLAKVDMRLCLPRWIVGRTTKLKISSTPLIRPLIIDIIVEEPLGNRNLPTGLKNTTWMTYRVFILTLQIDISMHPPDLVTSMTTFLDLKFNFIMITKPLCSIGHSLMIPIPALLLILLSLMLCVGPPTSTGAPTCHKETLPNVAAKMIDASGFGRTRLVVQLCPQIQIPLSINVPLALAT